MKKKKIEDHMKDSNLNWDGWDEAERERQGGGMLIVIAFIAGIAAVVGTVIYILS